jgi:hypothetical protein
MTSSAETEVRDALGPGFPKQPLHKIVCIGALVASRQSEGWRLDALGAPHIGERAEAQLILGDSPEGPFAFANFEESSSSAALCNAGLQAERSLGLPRVIDIEVAAGMNAQLAIDGGRLFVERLSQN